MNWKCAFGLHDWTKWEYYTMNITRTYSNYIFNSPYNSKNFEVTRRTRTCCNCGDKQDVFVSEIQVHN